MQAKTYDPAWAIKYARRWAYDRNPAYVDFSDMGGDCTNFVSQTLIAGGAVMNETPVMGWYFHSLANRTPSWSGVPFLWNFLTGNKGIGPYGHAIPVAEVIPGDIIQLRFAEKDVFSHCVLVVDTGSPVTLGTTYIACHSYDAFHRPMDTYSFVELRALRIDGVRD